MLSKLTSSKVMLGLICGLSFLADPDQAPSALLSPEEVGLQGSSLRELDHRVASVAYRLGLVHEPYCTANHPVTGLAIHQLAEYSARDHRQAAAAFGINKGPGVLSVVAGSPAARAGLRAGDVLLSVNGVPFAPPTLAAAEPDAKLRRAEIEATEAQLENALRGGPARLGLLRAGMPLSLTLTASKGCEIRGRLARSRQANAFADGRYAIMTTQMLDFIESDDELAVAMAHEAAHNLLGHPAQLEKQKVPHGILRSFGKNASRARATEEEADRLGIKLLWAAGYDVSAAIPFWRRLYAKYNPIPLPKLLSSHPSFAARERVIREVVSELSASVRHRPAGH